MEPEGLPFLSDDFFAESSAQPHRACRSCQRPAATCLCDALPEEPLLTATQVVILQHPMEAAKRLSTVPLISKVLRQTRTFLGRKFRPGSSPALDAALRGEHLVSNENLQKVHTQNKCPSTEYGDSRQACGSASNNDIHSDLGLRDGKQTCFASPSHIEEERVCGQHNDGSFSTGLSGQSGRLVLLLFPGPGARDLRHLAKERPAFRELEKTLVVIDGTWQHAKEMFSLLHPSLPDSVIQVCLPPVRECVPGMSETAPGGLILRKEPAAGYVSTLEAVARALFFCEPDGGRVQDALLAPLKKMVALQAAHNPAMAVKQARFDGR